jgi:hypothetical protein
MRPLEKYAAKQKLADLMKEAGLPSHLKKLLQTGGHYKKFRAGKGSTDDLWSPGLENVFQQAPQGSPDYHRLIKWTEGRRGARELAKLRGAAAAKTISRRQQAEWLGTEGITEGMRAKSRLTDVNEKAQKTLAQLRGGKLGLKAVSGGRS